MEFKEGNIEGVILREMAVHIDKRGWLTELFRDDELRDDFKPVMAYMSLTYPGVTRGPHEHKEQTDYFCFFGNFTLYLWDNRKDSPTYKNRMIVREVDRKIAIVPPGVVHAYRNSGEADGLVINLPDRLYAGWGRKEPVDEIRYEDDPESPFKL